MTIFKETDLYPPIKKFFTELGYDVKAEVKGCDVTMTKDGQLVIIELKKSFNMTLLYQALKRQKMTTQVYVAVPRPKSAKTDGYKSMLEVLERLGIGLITVAMDSPTKSVQIISFPPPVLDVKSPKKRAMVLKEMAGRTADANIGGSTKTKLMTAFREKSVKIACVLHKHGVLTAKELVHTYNCDKNSYMIMRNNYYGWFTALGNAQFALSDEGRKMLADDMYKEFVDYYMTSDSL